MIGTELSFTNSLLYGAWRDSGGAIVTEPLTETIDAWDARMSAAQESNGFQREEGSSPGKGKWYKYTFPDGWWYKVSMDAGALETQVKPFTEEEVRGGVGGYIHNFIFGTAESLGLTADKLIGGGHINLDIATTFDNDPRVFRRFLALYDHLFDILKILDEDPAARSFKELEGGSAVAWQVGLSEFEKDQMSIAEIAQWIRENVHTPESLDPELLGRLEYSVAQEFLKNEFEEEGVKEQFGVDRVEAVGFDSLMSELDGGGREDLRRQLAEKAQHNQATNVQHILGGSNERLELRRFSAQPNLPVLADEIDLVLSLIDKSREAGSLEDLRSMDWSEVVAKVKEIKTRLAATQSDILNG